MLKQHTFGTEKVHLYLVDTLNKLDKPSVAAKCMAMISPSRSWCSRMCELEHKGALTSRELANIVRLYRADQGATFRALNAQLDERLKAWQHELTDQGYIAMELENLALKLAMNIASAPVKDLICRLQKKRVKEDGDQKRVRRLRSGVSIDTRKLVLPVERELVLLNDLYVAGKVLL